ncbi:hypothetical protein BJY16_000160 [Actinoplanes octamycinicus]|uniref:Uncharacterized protein n=1 Tax=Actinoplanes octamycinicus TaxID=135948 RepID=A0A7W7GQY8_9ACTN|nr:hypothetical protein [Actinoplanes octamycinicus]
MNQPDDATLPAGTLLQDQGTTRQYSAGSGGA